MIDAPQGMTTLVVGDRVVHIRVDRSAAPRSVVVNVEIDYERSWSFEEPGWQELAFGVAGGVPYWWSARHLVTLPADVSGEPLVVSTDEDLRFAFAVTEGWLLVCETSVRLVIQGAETSRLELGEVLLAARWEGTNLVVGDATGHDITVQIADGRLVA